MKILVSSAHYYFSDKYGSEPQWVVDICNWYAKLGYEVEVIAGVADLERPLGEKVTLHFMFKKRPKSIVADSVLRLIYPIYSFFLSLYIYFKLKGKIDIVHHIAPLSPVSFDFFYIFRISKKAKYLIGPAMPPAQICNSRDITLNPGERSSLSSEVIYRLFFLFHPLLHFLFKKTVEKTDYLIASTSEAKKYYSKFIDCKKITVLPIGVDIGSLRSARKVRQKKEPLKILTVAYLTRRKGIDLLIEAVRVLKNKLSSNGLEVTVVGDGPEKDKLKKQVSKYGLDESFNFVGFIPHSEIFRYYTQADIFCNPTRHEPYGMTTIEAMVSGLPVVASEVNSIKELVGDAGLFFQKDNIQDLIQCLFILLTNSKLRRQMNQKALKRAEELYSWNKIVKKYTQI